MPQVAINIVPATISRAPGSLRTMPVSRRKRCAHSNEKAELILNKAETYATRPLKEVTSVLDPAPLILI